MSTDTISAKAQITLERLLPRLQPTLDKAPDKAIFEVRLRQHFPTIFAHLYELYSDQYDFYYHLEQILIHAADYFIARPADLKALDQAREADQDWFQHEQMVGGVCYVDLFAENLKGVRKHISYFKELGLTYLHLMPLFKAPEGNSDGGYAVSSFREVNSKLGTMKELAALAGEFRQAGISLTLDFVFNHTSDEHDWALKAVAGDEKFQDFYFIFPDRTMPDRYEFDERRNRVLREIFPEQAPGAFTYRADMRQWVWTTFNHFQWDLNYRNPEVFDAMLGEMLSLANNGVEILRLDAVAFIWKQMGTGCENLPQVHTIIQCYNAFCRLVAPAMLFKSEAIVHPREVATYINWDECPISYNPTLMALCWEAIATREVKLLRQSMQHWFGLPEHCAWVNYIRSHDDIGWTFADEDGWLVGINGFEHRKFLNSFYSGRFPGSFAKGQPFNYNEETGDMRISGTCASLAGLEQALELKFSLYEDHAIKRIVMIYSIALSAGGIPLIYLGDEIGTLNDYRYSGDPAKAQDSRWVHRPHFDWEKAKRRKDAQTVEGRLFQWLVRLITLRKHTPLLGGGTADFFDNGNGHVLSFTRNGKLLVLVNFSEYDETVYVDGLKTHWTIPAQATDLTQPDDPPVTFERGSLRLEPYQFMWLQPV
jgi:amylosucrase